MPKSFAQQTIPIGHPDMSDQVTMRDPAWAEWQARVDRGLIGSRSSMRFDQRLRMMRNEIALFGCILTRELERF